MLNQKLEAELSLALSLTEAERQNQPFLNSGYQKDTGLWKLILLYNGSLQDVQEEVPFSFTPLLGNFAIIEIRADLIPALLSYPQILYLELSRPLYIDAITGIPASCFTSGSYPPPVSAPLTGRGTAVGILDSGVDFRHPDFRTETGASRILTYWDQSLPYDGENRYGFGYIFSNEDLNRILSGASGDRIRPSDDLSGHGTHVAGICAGNGRVSGGRNRGAAPEASLLVIKLKNEAASVYTDYANLMMAVDYSVRYASQNNIPLSINISYGSNDGSHSGDSLIELFLNHCIYYGRNTITVATGNEGLTRRHAGSRLLSGSMSFPFSIAPGENSIYLQLWKYSADRFSFELSAPSQENVPFSDIPGIYQFRLNDCQLRWIVGEPTPYQPRQEIFVSIAPYLASSSAPSLSSSAIPQGVWQLTVSALSAANGSIHLWLPSREATNAATGFLNPSTDMTFTIPSTASSVISVSGYDSSTDVFASFSGQGFSNSQNTKPDLCAPAVNILSTAPGGGYSIRTGTSMAAPFVSGAAALLLQYGIVEGNDPFLYGQKAKAALWGGARSLPAFQEYPNEKAGWGALCMRESAGRL